MADQRLEPVYEILEEQQLDAVAFVPGPNFKRIFNQDFHLMERPLVIIVPATGNPVAIVPSLEMASFEKLSFGGPVFAWRDEDGYQAAFQSAAEALPRLQKSGKFGLEAQRMRVFEQMALTLAFPSAGFCDAHQALSSVRLLKTSREIGELRKAISISEAALEATLETVKVGQTEMQIKNQLLNALFAHGADGLSFDPIVAAGDNSAEPHASVRPDYRLQKGDALLIDFGARWNGYCADITRTFFAAEASNEDRAFYETVRAANRIGKSVIRPSVTAHDVDDAVQQSLESSRFNAYIRHKTGHGLGLDVHEAPQIMRGNAQPLEPGMVFTVEPGLYREGRCGVRIEDNVVVTETAMECLTQFPTDLRLVAT